MLAFRDKVVVVTGANGGIGSAIAQAFVARGALVALVGRRLNALVDTAKELDLPEDRLWYGVADLSDSQEVESLGRNILEYYGRIDILIHAAGSYSAGAIEDSSFAEHDMMQAVNLRAPMVLTKALLPSLRSTRGQIAFLNSSLGRAARGGVASYAASKHALAAFADSLRDEMNPMGIRVLSMFIGRTASAMQQKVHALEGRPYRPEHLLQPEDVASALVDALRLDRTAEITNLEMRPMRSPWCRRHGEGTGSLQD